MDTILGMGLALVVGVVFLAPGARAESGGGALNLKNPFFAMDTGTKDGRHQTAEAQAAMLKELGYAGIGYTGFKNLPELLRELDERDLKLFTIYIGVWIEPEGNSYDEDLEEGLELLKGRDTILWLTVMSQHWGRSDEAGDAQAVKVVREIADLAKPAGASLALYPHVGSWLERVEDAVRVAKKAKRDNVGATFNLYHWLRTDELTNMKPLLEKALPYLHVVTINGSSNEGSIETLDKCTFDIHSLLKTLKDLGYNGPIGLQGYGIGGDVHDNLQRSMAAWRSITATVPVSAH